MRRKEGIKLFSTSSIDLLACGLGGVLALWLLVFGNQGGAETGDRPVGSGEMRIRQFGTSHLVGFDINGYTLQRFERIGVDGTRETGLPPAFKPEEAFDRIKAKAFCTNQGNRWRFVATYVEDGGSSEIEVSCRASDDFAREIAISFSDMRVSHEVGLMIETCSAHEIHYLEMQSIDRRGVNEARYVFHCEGDARAALRNAPGSPWERFFQAQIAKEVKRMCPPDSWEKPFNYRVFDCSFNVALEMGVRFASDGAVRFVEPTPLPSTPQLGTIEGASIRESIVSWSGSTYGAGRLPAGLPACTP